MSVMCGNKQRNNKTNKQRRSSKMNFAVLKTFVVQVYYLSKGFTAESVWNYYRLRPQEATDVSFNRDLSFDFGRFSVRHYKNGSIQYSEYPRGY